MQETHQRSEFVWTLMNVGLRASTLLASRSGNTSQTEGKVLQNDHQDPPTIHHL